MAKRAEPQGDLDEFLDSIPPASAPKNLGNIPDEIVAAQMGLDPRRPRPAEDDPPADEPPPSDPPAGEPPPEESPREAEPAEPPPAAPSADDRLAELEQRLQAQSRELEFLRRGATAPAATAAPAGAPADLTPETILPFDVTESDIANIIAGGPQSAEAVRNALRATAYSGALAAIRYLTAAYQQTRTQETTADSMRETFWSQNQDLADYPEIVAAAAQQTAAEFPHADATTLIATTSQRARRRLTQMGARLSAGTPPASTAGLPRVGRTTKRPATAEMAGGSGRPNGRANLTAIERDILSLVPR